MRETNTFRHFRF